MVFLKWESKRYIEAPGDLRRAPSHCQIHHPHPPPQTLPTTSGLFEEDIFPEWGFDSQPSSIFFRPSPDRSISRAQASKRVPPTSWLPKVRLLGFKTRSGGIGGVVMFCVCFQVSWLKKTVFLLKFVSSQVDGAKECWYSRVYIYWLHL